jgi:hypothetical protein
MAITFSEKFRADLGGRKWRMFDITHDESRTSISASDVDLTYIDFYQHAFKVMASAPANTSLLARYMTISMDALHSKLIYTSAPPDGSISNLIVIGW